MIRSLARELGHDSQRRWQRWGRMLPRQLCVPKNKYDAETGEIARGNLPENPHADGKAASEAKIETLKIPADEANAPLEKAYQPDSVESGRYEWWEENNCFRAPDLKKNDERQTFSMVDLFAYSMLMQQNSL